MKKKNIIIILFILLIMLFIINNIITKNSMKQCKKLHNQSYCEEVTKELLK